MDTKELKVKIKLAWWFVYLYWPAVREMLRFARMFNEDAQPNWERFQYWLNKAVIVKNQ